MNIPKPFCFNPKKIKAFVLGCDPTNFSNQGESVQLNYVFGIGQDYRYFRDILQNMNAISLHLEDVYVQNMILDYQEEETGKNSRWEEIAEQYLKERMSEFDGIDPKRKIPVILTAERLYTFLIKDNETKFKAQELYQNKTDIPIKAVCNKLDRPLIPLYRHPQYSLKHWERYRIMLKHWFS